METLANTYLSRRYWWVLALRGFLALLFGLAAVVWPGVTLIALVIIFGAFVLVDGIMAVVMSVQGRQVFRYWWVLLLEGLAGIAIGIMTFFWPGVTALVLLFFIAAWAIVTGIIEIIAAFVLRDVLTGEWALVVAGVLSILLGILLAVQPQIGLLTITLFVGIYAIIFGVLLIIRAFQLRSAGPAVLRTW